MHMDILWSILKIIGIFLFLYFFLNYFFPWFTSVWTSIDFENLIQGFLCKFSPLGCP